VVLGAHRGRRSATPSALTLPVRDARFSSRRGRALDPQAPPALGWRGHCGLPFEAVTATTRSAGSIPMRDGMTQRVCSNLCSNWGTKPWICVTPSGRQRTHGATPRSAWSNSGPQGRGFDSLQAHQLLQFNLYRRGLRFRLLSVAFVAIFVAIVARPVRLGPRCVINQRSKRARGRAACSRHALARLLPVATLAPLRGVLLLESRCRKAWT
jgi:hypothetical protein